MFSLPKSLAAWNTPDFAAVLKAELEAVDGSLLPLQQGLAQSSYALTDGFSVMLLGASQGADALEVRVGIAYSGIIPGCACADDPTPISELPEYCELVLAINRETSEVRLTPSDQPFSSS